MLPFSFFVSMLAAAPSRKRPINLYICTVQRHEASRGTSIEKVSETSQQCGCWWLIELMKMNGMLAAAESFHFHLFRQVIM